MAYCTYILIVTASFSTCLILPQYWVVYAFLTVFESAINAVYWFRTLTCRIRDQRLFVDGFLAFYYTFKFILVVWMALPQTNGAAVVFRSLIQPLFARFFENNQGSTSANLRATADQATGKTQ